MFYLPLAGKSKPIKGEPLKPENVSFDVTSGLDQAAPNDFPLVFLTGYRVDYSPGGKAVSLVKGYPPYGGRPRTWSEWFHGFPLIPFGPYLIVSTKNAYTSSKPLVIVPGGNDFVPDFIPRDFHPQGKTYRQLTPDGSLTP